MNVEITFSFWKCIQPRNQLVHCVQIWSRIFSFGRVTCGEKCRFPHDWSRQKKKFKLRCLSQKQKNVSIQKSDYDISKEALHENGIFVILCACFCSRISTATYRINSFYTRCVLKLSYSIQLIFNMNWQQN